jgi:hypothetical protein
MTTDDADLGRLNFQTYAERVMGRAHDGKPIPLWDALGADTRAAWTAGAVAVAERVGDELAYREQQSREGQWVGMRASECVPLTGLWVCTGCYTTYAGSLGVCPNCGGARRISQGEQMAKISAAAGGSDATVNPPTSAWPSTAVDGAGNVISQTREDQAKAYNDAVQRQDAGTASDEDLAFIERYEGGKPSVGSSSSTSSRATATSTSGSDTSRRSPAPTTDTRSTPDQTGSSTADSTDGSGTASSGKSTKK